MTEKSKKIFESLKTEVVQTIVLLWNIFKVLIICFGILYFVFRMFPHNAYIYLNVENVEHMDSAQFYAEIIDVNGERLFTYTRIGENDIINVWCENFYIKSNGIPVFPDADMIISIQGVGVLCCYSDTIYTSRMDDCEVLLLPNSSRDDVKIIASDVRFGGNGYNEIEVYSAYPMNISYYINGAEHVLEIKDDSVCFCGYDEIMDIIKKRTIYISAHNEAWGLDVRDLKSGWIRGTGELFFSQSTLQNTYRLSGQEVSFGELTNSNLAITKNPESGKIQSVLIGDISKVSISNVSLFPNFYAWIYNNYSVLGIALFTAIIGGIYKAKNK